jgi:superfamily II DNA or RNA helicase
MIELEIRPARVFFNGPEDELEQMFKCLRVRVQDKGSFWRAKKMLEYKRNYIHSLPEEEQEAEREKIIEASKYIKFYNRRTDSFATGLLHRVKKYLKHKRIKYRTKELRKPVPVSGKHFKRIKFQDKIEQRDEQIRAVKQALDAGRGIIACATNAGKTDMAAAIIYEFWKQTGKVPQVLFIVHRKGVAQQSMERFKKHLDSAVFPTAMLGGGNKKIPKAGILASTTQTATLMAESRDLDFMEFLHNCDILFFDEFHVNKATQANRVADLCSAPMRFGLSGTIDEENKLKMMHYIGMTGPVIARISNKELVDKGRSARPHIRFVEIKTEKLKKLSFQEAYREGIVYCKVRNRSIVKEALRYANKNLPTLIMVSRKKHGFILKRKLEKRTDVPIEYILGPTPMPVRRKIIRRFEMGETSILICSPVFDVGMDIPVIGAVVFAGGGIGWELVLQRLGRVLRRKKGENQILITDYIDRHNTYLMRHSVARLKHYQKERIATFEFKEAA